MLSPSKRYDGMLAQDQDDAEVLTGLGLTLVQAEVYLTLARMGKATIKSLSKAVEMDRANIYRIIQKLFDLNLIQEIVTTPTMYRSVPLQEVVPFLLKQKEEEYIKIRSKSKRLLKKRKHVTDKSSFEESQFILFPKGSGIIRKVSEMTARVEKSHCILFYWSDFKDTEIDLYEMWKSILDKGVMITALVHLEEGEEFPTKLLNLKKNNLFRIRRVHSPVMSSMIIFDGKEAFVSTMPKIVSGPPCLWINNSHLVTIFQLYFDSLWDNSEEMQ
jgi:sugar-specific transcriptional regulator TrmB